ncbi:MAG: TIGR04076 family protein [Candidatus Kariarchaeaceae archaeon]|jgi:uncharacterized repeat protein (TIGR04076 family)
MTTRDELTMPTQNNTPEFPEITIEITNILGEGPCSRGHNIGEIFSYPKDRDKMCPSALSILRPYILVLAYGGNNIYTPDNPNTFSLSCPDPSHPVVYKLTRKE